MNRFYGAVGFVSTQQTSPGVWVEVATERSYYGDVIKNNRILRNSDNLNDNVDISNSISIVADPYANEHFFNIRYVKWMGVSWRVSNVDVETPRLILTLGGVHNG